MYGPLYVLQPLVPLTVPFVKVAEATTSPSSAPSSVFLASTQVVPSKVIDEPAVVGDAVTSFELPHALTASTATPASATMARLQRLDMSTPLVAAFWSTDGPTVMRCGRAMGGRLAW